MSSKWSDPLWIRKELQRKWDSGRILRSLLEPDDLFPLRIALKRPKSNEINENFAEISRWIKSLKKQSKYEAGFGYELVEKDIVHRQSGRNLLPTHAIIPTTQDALRLLRKEREGDRFLELAQQIQAEWPSLKEWILKYPHKVLAANDDWSGILAVLNWFFNHPCCGLYLRQLDIPGIDTKFIEQRKGLLSELLNIILPDEVIDHKTSSFELRFGLQVKPVQIRLRFLDQQKYLQGISDITVPVDQLAEFNPRVLKVFITENEINGLCFPDVKDALVIFGMGYGVEVLKSVPWLKEKDIYYWGDIDTHGFAILDQVRGFLPQAHSLLMDERILMLHKHLWVKEEKPSFAPLNRLTEDEHRLFSSLQNNTWGQGVRLEQERISFQEVKVAVETLVHNS